MDKNNIENIIKESIAVKNKLLSKSEDILKLCKIALDTVKNGGVIFFCGNGGSACDAAHASCELAGWFRKKHRSPIRAVALGFETPLATAIGNDKGFEEVFARQLEALAKPGDLLIAISTSGKSPSILRALETAGKIGIFRAALLGGSDSPAKKLSDFCVEIPSIDTPRIQECHLLVLHILSEFVELKGTN